MEIEKTGENGMFFLPCNELGCIGCNIYSQRPKACRNFECGVLKSVEKTGHLLVVDSGTLTSGFAAEVIASTSEAIDPRLIKKPPKRLTLPDAPAPTSHVLEDEYYVKVSDVVEAVKSLLL